MEEISNDSFKTTTVIIDTSAFHDVNSDFIGVNSELLPSFFVTIKEKDILLLTHPVLDGEIKKHIDDSSLVKNQQQLVVYLRKTENLLKMAGCFSDEFTKKINSFDIRSELYKGYLGRYKDAVRLDYPKWEKVFDKYFKAAPPFSETGKKKAEFPDAVIIESVSEYIEEHENDRLLVVSRDGDWVNSFKDNESVEVVDSIEKAIHLINEVDCVLSEDMMCLIYNSALDDIHKSLQFYLDSECYDVTEYEFEEDFEADSVEIININDFFTLLRASRNQMLIHTDVEVQVSGKGVVFDVDRSVWDSEDKCYWLREFADLDVTKATANIKVEILIDFDFDNPTEVTVVKTKLLNIGNIDLDLVEYSLEPINTDDDMGEIYDALDGHVDYS